MCLFQTEGVHLVIEENILYAFSQTNFIGQVPVKIYICDGDQTQEISFTIIIDAPCLDEYNLLANAGDEYFQAMDSIQSIAKIIQTANVTYNAPGVILNAEFEVPLLTTFIVLLEGCN